MAFIPPKNKTLHDRVSAALTNHFAKEDQMSDTKTCPRCSGAGMVTPGGGFALNPGNRMTDPCPRCGGTGKVKKDG